MVPGLLVAATAMTEPGAAAAANSVVTATDCASVATTADEHVRHLAQVGKALGSG